MATAVRVSFSVFVMHICGAKFQADTAPNISRYIVF